MAGSRLGRLIVALNLLGLAILISGALILNELRRGLIQGRIDSLTTQGELIANVTPAPATRGSPQPALEADKASELLQLLFIPRSQRARLFDGHGRLLADSYLTADQVSGSRCRAKKPGGVLFRWRLQDKGARNPQVIESARKQLNWRSTAPSPPGGGGHAPRPERRARGVGVDPDPARPGGPSGC
ncbi:MAG: sensor N-terminal transmembrane domain-containing protein [Caulobacteraceae bacterium]